MTLLHRRAAWLGVLVLALPFLQVRAQDSASSDPRNTTALRLAPADTSLFSTTLHLKDRLQRLWKTKAAQQAWNTPLVQAGWTEVLKKWEQEGAPVREALKDKQNQELLRLLTEMASDEIFLMCGPNTPRLFSVLGRGLYSMQGANLGRAFGVQPNPAEMFRETLREFRKHKEDLRAPDIVVGFKIKDPKVAVRQVARLEVLLNLAAMAVPGMTGKVKHQKLNGFDFATVNLDGSLVPWDQIPWDQIEEENGEFTPLIEHLKKLRLTICLGTYEDYLVCAVGESTDIITRLGKGKKLAELPEFAPLQKHLGKPIHGIAYLSASLSGGTTKSDVEEFKTTLKDLIEDSDQNEAMKKRMAKDLDELAADVLKFANRPASANLYVNFGTERGEEMFHYQFGRNPSVDYSKPLGLLGHAGGDPILMVADRSVSNPAVWDTFVKWCKKADGYFRDLDIPFVPEESRKKGIEVLEALYPVFRKIDRTTRENLIPALADGQCGFVVDNKLRSKRWFRDMPMAKEPVPILEPALVLGVSDQVKLQKAAGDYRSAFNDALKILREHEVPIPEEFEWPAPRTRQVGDATFYFYAFPNELELDGRLTPTAAVGKHVAALTVSNEHAQRLLQVKPLHPGGGPLADLNRPLGGAVYFKMSALVDTALPWVDYAVDQPDVDRHVAKHASDIRTILRSLRLFDQYTSATYLEGNMTVTHGEWVIQDVK